MRRSERGGASLSVEVLMWAPIALVVIGFVAAIGRMSMAQDAVRGAAGAAARAASLEREGQSAQSAAVQAATAKCERRHLSVHPSCRSGGHGIRHGYVCHFARTRVRVSDGARDRGGPGRHLPAKERLRWMSVAAVRRRCGCCSWCQ